MGKQKKTMERLLAGQADAHMGFDDLRSLLLSLGFEERIRGSHHLFSKRGIVEKNQLATRWPSCQTVSSQASACDNPHIPVDESDMMYKYEIILYWSEPDQLFVAEVPELPGCVAHGKTQDEALKQARIAMGLWLDTAREQGEPIPEPKGRRLMYA